MKSYESIPRISLTRRIPVMIRVDGRAFHTYTNKAKKPFDSLIMHAMLSAALNSAKDMQGFKVGYVQSDEASFLLTDYESIETEAWFDYNLQKITTAAASDMTMFFNDYIEKYKIDPELWDTKDFPDALRFNGMARFDARAWNIPVEEVSNYFLWRAKDWERNSLQMYCRSIFSHKQLIEKKKENMHEMLHQAGKNWTNDLSDWERNGVFIIKGEEGETVERFDVLPNFRSIDEIVAPLANRHF